MSYLNNLNVIFAGCAKNCEKYLPDVFNNIQSYSSIFKKTFKIIDTGKKENNNKKKFSLITKFI